MPHMLQAGFTEKRLQHTGPGNPKMHFGAGLDTKCSVQEHKDRDPDQALAIFIGILNDHPLRAATTKAHHNADGTADLNIDLLHSVMDFPCSKWSQEARTLIHEMSPA